MFLGILRSLLPCTLLFVACSDLAGPSIDVPARHFLGGRAAPGLHTLTLSFERDRVHITPFLLY
jgi:hypothetical protein